MREAWDIHIRMLDPEAVLVVVIEVAPMHAQVAGVDADVLDATARCDLGAQPPGLAPN